ncbi:hypothetical protein Tco_0798687 [Tanacetum coccineum]
MHIFVGCFVYVVDFMILEDLGSIIDNGLSEVVLGKPFAQTSKLTYDESLGLIRFAQKDDEVVFRMPQRTKELDQWIHLEKDKFEAFFMESLKVIFDEKKLEVLRKFHWMIPRMINKFTHVTSPLLSKLGSIRSHDPVRTGGIYPEPEDGVTNYTRHRHNSSSDGVTYFMTVSARTNSNADLEDSFYDGATTKMRRWKRDCVERIHQLCSISSLSYDWKWLLEMKVNEVYNINIDLENVCFRDEEKKRILDTDLGTHHIHTEVAKTEAVPDWKDKDWSKVVITDEILKYAIVKDGRNWKENNERVDIIFEDLWQKAYNESEVVKKVVVISSSDEDLSSDEEITLMGDIPFSDTNEEQPQTTLTSTSIQDVKLTNCILALRAVNAQDVDVGSSSTRRNSSHKPNTVSLILQVTRAFGYGGFSYGRLDMEVSLITV